MTKEKASGITCLKPPSRYESHKFSPAIKEEVGALATDDWHGILYLTKDLVIIGACAASPPVVSWWLSPFSVFLIAAHQRGIATIMHDAAHRVLARRKILNETIGCITSWLIFQLFCSYRLSHVQLHHPYLGRSDKDPDLCFFAGEDVFRPMSDRDFFQRIILLPMLGVRNWRYIRYLIANRVSVVMEAVTSGSGMSDVERSAVRMEITGFLAFWFTLLGLFGFFNLLPILLLFWVVPFVTAYPVIGWFIELSEHSTSTEGRTLNVHMARNRRSRHVEKWLFGINNDHYHLDHHLDPRTPFWLLPKAHSARLRDPVYRRHCEETGGLFQPGLNGRPSIIQLLLSQNRQRFEKGGRSGATHPDAA